MKAITNIVGIILIIVGVITLAYRGYTYTTQEKVVQFGELQITAEKENTIHFPPLLGGLSLVAGVILVIVARRK